MTHSRIRFLKRIRRGFSLIEVMVAMTIFSLVMVSFGKAIGGLALRGRNGDLAAKRNASLQLEANKFGAVPFARLAAWSTADQTITRGTFTYTRRITITQASTSRYSIKIIVIPSSDATKKDSVMLDRTKPPSSALCTTC
jgi:prepilin-type N-terminal cleavage/methylation domain-containing protein